MTVVVYFAGLTMPLVGPDEPRYSQVAREMFERGDWVTPTLAGFHWFEKPALLYWLQIGSYNLFGVSEFAARFGSALFGLGTIVSLYLLGRHIERRAMNDEAEPVPFANLLALIAASTVGIIAFAHGASFDIILTFPITAAMVSFFTYDASKRSAALVSFYFFIGVALLAKGLIGIVFPAAIAGLYHILIWKLPDRRLLQSAFWGTLLAVAVAALWYLPMYQRHGFEFIDEFFIQHHFQRFTSNKYLHPQPFYFFLWVLPLMTIPWLPFFLATLWKFGRDIVTGDVDRDSIESRLRIFAAAWILVPLVFFSFSGSKLPGYILPAVPAAMILTSDFVYRFIHKSAVRRQIVLAFAGGTLLVVTMVALFVAPRFADGDSVKRLFAPSVANSETADLPVFMLHFVSHNAEFYAAGRIIREAAGKQKRFHGTKEIADAMRSRGLTRALVLVPIEHVNQLLKSADLASDVRGENGDVVLAEVTTISAN
ncbi:MAG TPA: glycosyltransferase family 39 protein [Pyrinomonadaceae bacterium]|nr:glycosyltransferase family 39 protein [Pyrinomonadaceae bacterium]